MLYILSKRFERDFAVLPKSVKKKVLVVLQKFVDEPRNPSLHTHGLSGKWSNHYSINSTGDTRVVYVLINDNVIHFVAVGSHSELHG